jgi:hypothetical protein
MGMSDVLVIYRIAVKLSSAILSTLYANDD